jgi:hypothetical protein
VSDTWDRLLQQLAIILQQLAIILSKMAEKLVQDAMGWLLIFWLAWCLFGINWRKAWTVLAQGAWAPLVLAMILAALAWSQMTPDAPYFWKKLGQVTLVVAASFFCGWVQGYFGWQPVEVNLEPVTSPAHGHHHHSVPAPGGSH